MMKKFSLIFALVFVMGCGGSHQYSMLDPVMDPFKDDPTAEAPADISRYNVNRDGVVNTADLTLISGAIEEKQQENPELNIEANGIVDRQNVILVTDHLTE